MERKEFYKNVKNNLQHSMGLTFKSWQNLDNGLAVRSDYNIIFVKITRNVVTICSHGTYNHTDVTDYNKDFKSNMVPITCYKIEDSLKVKKVSK